MNEAAVEHAADPSRGGWLAGDGLWVGEHTGDHDLLVFDSSDADPEAANLRFFSLTQLRHRTFPRSLVNDRIREVTDAARLSDARARYRDREALRAELEQGADAARVEANRHQRDGVLALHRRYLEANGIEYKGVGEPTEGRKQRRTRCASCGIALDNFFRVECAGCRSVVCSCGACSCNPPAREAAAN